MRSETLDLLPYLLPIKSPLTDDCVILTVKKCFYRYYSDIILSLLRVMGVLPEDKQYINKSELQNVIATVKATIEYPQLNKGHVWIQDNGDLSVIASCEHKADFINTLIEQKKNGHIVPNKFLVECKQSSNFKNKCIVGYIFANLLILFYQIITYINLRQYATEKELELHIMQILNLLSTASELEVIIRAFKRRQAYSNGAVKTAYKKNEIKKLVNSIVIDLNIRPKNVLKRNISSTINRVRSEYKLRTNTEFPYDLTKLEEYIIDAPKRQSS